MARNPTWTCVVALALRGKDGRWLLHRRPAGKHHAGLWEFPGGKVEPGETPEDALVREIAEETAIALETRALVPSMFAQGPGEEGRPPIVILLYTAGAYRGEAKALEGGELAWFAEREIGALALAPLDRELHARLFGKGPLGPGKEGCQG